MEYPNSYSFIDDIINQGLIEIQLRHILAIVPRFYGLTHDVCLYATIPFIVCVDCLCKICLYHQT